MNTQLMPSYCYAFVCTFSVIEFQNMELLEKLFFRR